jgi:hypothetical protein
MPSDPTSNATTPAAASIRERREWCDEHCPGSYEIEPLGPNPEQLTGRRFRFESDKIAVHFKLRRHRSMTPVAAARAVAGRLDFHP